MARDINGSKIIPKKQQNIAVSTAIQSQLAIMEQNLMSNGIVQYPNDEQGLELFKGKTMEYLAYIQQVNDNPEIEREIIPDIEGWATYLGINRSTISSYLRRSEKWRSTIENVKNGIAAIKKQLALQGKIPPIMAIFDLTNNHGYVNSSEFKVSQQTDGYHERRLSAKEIEEKYGNQETGVIDVPFTEVPSTPKE